MNLSAAELSTLRWKSTAYSVAEADALLARLWGSTESRQQISGNTSSDGSGGYSARGTNRRDEPRGGGTG